jgi:hypothetical protein
MAKNQTEALQRVQNAIQAQTNYKKESLERLEGFKEALDEGAKQRQEELQKYLEESARKLKEYNNTAQARKQQGTENTTARRS